MFGIGQESVNVGAEKSPLLLTLVNKLELRMEKLLDHWTQIESNLLVYRSVDGSRRFEVCNPYWDRKEPKMSMEVFFSRLICVDFQATKFLYLFRQSWNKITETKTNINEKNCCLSKRIGEKTFNPYDDRERVCVSVCTCKCRCVWCMFCVGNEKS